MGVFYRLQRGAPVPNTSADARTKLRVELEGIGGARKPLWEATRIEMSKSPCRLHPFATCARGLAAIEFGIIAPIVGLLALAVLDFGRVVLEQRRVNTWATKGVQYAL